MEYLGSTLPLPLPYWFLYIPLFCFLYSFKRLFIVLSFLLAPVIFKPCRILCNKSKKFIHFLLNSLSQPRIIFEIYYTIARDGLDST